jgi:hypothetical protein
MKSNISNLLWQISICLSCSQKTEKKIFENSNIIRILLNEIKKDYYFEELETQLLKFFIKEKLYTTILSIYSLSTQKGKCEYLIVPDMLILLLQFAIEYTLQTLVICIFYNIFCVYYCDCDIINSDFSSVYSPGIIIMNGELNPKEIQKCCSSLLNLLLSCFTSFDSTKHSKFLSIILPSKIDSVLTTDSEKLDKFELKCGTKIVLRV